MALRFDYVSGEMYDDGEPDTSPLFSGLPLYARDPYADEGGFSDSPPALLSGGVETADQAYRTSPESGDTSFGRFIKDLMGAGGAKSLLGKGLDFATSKAGMAGLAALFALLDRQGKIGGGATMGMPAPRQYARTMTQGAYGPIARYAANGGLMQAYAQGGHVQMEDGGFVMTKKAVDGAGGPQGLASLVPGARMIGGPPDPTGRKDLTPAVIHGPHGATPAKVSRGEAYVPKRAVDQNGGARQMYALMNKLQRRA